MKHLFAVILFCLLSIQFFAYGQNSRKVSITMASGSLDALKEEESIKFEFTYNDMVVGMMTEEEYVNKKVGEYNGKEEGRGDKWREAWTADRENRFKPKFIELFDKYIQGRFKVGDNANYVIVFNTEFTEPGFNVGVMRKPASIDLTGKVLNIETGEQIATMRIKNSSANSFTGFDFDTGYRLQESYGKAGREFAKFLLKKLE